MPRQKAKNYSYDDQTKKLVKLSEEDLKPKDLENPNEGIWSIQEIWNEMNVMKNEKTAKVRDYITMGDLGKTDYWSLYQKITGVESTNKPDERGLRIFACGDVFHDIMKAIFKKAGIFINSQDDKDEEGNNQWSIIPETETEMKVLGKYDVLAGGKPNLNKAFEYIEDSDLSEFFKDKAKKIAKYFDKKFKNGLKPIIYDFKSINSMAFWGKRNYLLEAYPHHVMQLYGYLKANNIHEGRLLYISKDDLVLAEFPIYYPTERYEQKLKEQREKIHYYWKNKITPPKPEFVVFDPKATLKFQKNKVPYAIKGCYKVPWELGYSSYLTLLTGCKNKAQFEAKMKPSVKKKNDAMKAEIIKSLKL